MQKNAKTPSRLFENMKAITLLHRPPCPFTG